MSEEYTLQNFKIPRESPDYPACSDFVISSIHAILEAALHSGHNKIILNTNLRCGLPMENINKIAGPLVEAWAYELFSSIAENPTNQYALINVEAQKRLSISDVVLQFRRSNTQGSVIAANIDVKATSEDIKGSGKSPNITSYPRIRTAYVEDPNYIFVILSLKHKAIVVENQDTHMMEGVMEIVGHNVYDLKYISEPDITYNPALGKGQFQIPKIQSVNLVKRNTWEFCQLLDKKYLNSSKRSPEQWLHEATENGWIQ